MTANLVLAINVKKNLSIFVYFMWRTVDSKEKVGGIFRYRAQKST